MDYGSRIARKRSLTTTSLAGARRNLSIHFGSKLVRYSQPRVEFICGWAEFVGVMVAGATEIRPSGRNGSDECPVSDVVAQAKQLRVGAAPFESRNAEMPETPQGSLNHQPAEDRSRP